MSASFNNVDTNSDLAYEVAFGKFPNGSTYMDAMKGIDRREEIKAGLFALACLPTTVSSCTVFTGMAGGNVSGAIFNAALANMAGVFITPLLFSFMLGRSTLALPMAMLLEVLLE